LHNNYYFINALRAELEEKLKGFSLSECFTQQKEELILIFEQGASFFILQAHLGSDFSALNFPETFTRAKKNVQNLFPEIIGQTVEAVLQVKNERAFIVKFNNRFQLLFKLHGNRSNIILFQQKNLLKVFKQKLKNDFLIAIENLDRNAAHTLENYGTAGFAATFFTFGRVLEKVLQERRIEALPSQEARFDKILELRNELESPKAFYITRFHEKVILSLVNIGTVISTHHTAIAAANAFYQAHYRFIFFETAKKQLEQHISQKKKRTEDYIKNTQTKLEELEKQEAPEKIADIIMANLHAISPGSEKANLFNFYTNEPIEIHLKKDLSPQKYAETLYKKGKKRPLELKNLHTLLEEKVVTVFEMEADLETIEKADSHKGLQALAKKYQGIVEEDKKKGTGKFRHFEAMGFQVFVGRNAGNNDELTTKFAHKDDLWLHARDATGSHVVVKHQAGKPFPKPVIEKAAAVAAFYSERKNDSLCPVIYTFKKFVRKVKGSPKGAVKVEKENVLMVVPADFRN